MSGKKQIAVTVDLDYWQQAKARGLNISEACNQGLRIVLGISNDEQQITQKIEERETELVYYREQLEKITKNREEAEGVKASEKDRYEQLIDMLGEDFQGHPYIGKDSIKEYALKLELPEDLAIKYVEDKDLFRIKNFHYEKPIEGKTSVYGMK